MRLIFILGAIMLVAACATPDIARQPKLISYPVDAGCHAVPVPDVTVDLVSSGPTEDRSASYRVLSQRDTDGQGPSIKHHEVTFGITSSRIHGRRLFDVYSAPMADGQTCVWIKQAKFVANWDIRVNIAAEIKPGTCPDRVVRAHEAQHVALDQRLQPFFAQTVKSVLIEHGRVSVVASSVAAGQQKLTDVLSQMAADTMDNFILDRDNQQIAIDTPAEYDRVMRQCDRADWAKLVR